MGSSPQPPRRRTSIAGASLRQQVAHEEQSCKACMALSGADADYRRRQFTVLRTLRAHPYFQALKRKYDFLDLAEFPRPGAPGRSSIDFFIYMGSEQRGDASLTQGAGISVELIEGGASTCYHYNATKNRKVNAATAKALRTPTGDCKTVPGIHLPPSPKVGGSVH